MSPTLVFLDNVVRSFTAVFFPFVVIFLIGPLFRVKKEKVLDRLLVSRKIVSLRKYQLLLSAGIWIVFRLIEIWMQHFGPIEKYYTDMEIFNIDIVGTINGLGFFGLLLGIFVGYTPVTQFDSVFLGL